MLLFVDPCGKFYATAAQALSYGYLSITAATVKTSGLPAGAVESTCWDMSPANSAMQIITPVTAGPIFFGGRFYFTSMPSNFILMQYQNATTQGQINIVINNNGTISIKNTGSGALIGTSSASTVLTAPGWNDIEISALISATVGTAGVQINGTNLLSVTGANTYNTGAVNIGDIIITGYIPGNPVYLQDLYIADSTGTYNNGFLGDISLSVANASRPGSFAQFANNGAATNWQCMADVTPDDLTTYVSDSTPGDRTSVGYASLAAGTPLAVIHVSRVSKSDAGSRTFAQTIRSQAADVIGTTTAPSTSFAYYKQIVETDPNTGVPWTSGAINALEGGIKTIA